MPPSKKKEKKKARPSMSIPVYAVVRQRIKDFKMSKVQEDTCIIDTQRENETTLYEELKMYGIVPHNVTEKKYVFMHGLAGLCCIINDD